jgi:RNase P/RNase MRP subunit POP5
MYLDGVLAGEREAGDKLLAALGLVRITRYKRITPKAKQGAA